MRGIVFRQGGQVVVETLPDPEPGPDEVLIRVRASGICHTDLEILRGNYGASAFPLVPGHEYSGEVIALGPDVRGFAPGDAVVVDPNIGCGNCPGCRVDRVNLCENLGAYGVTLNGGFAEASVVRARALTPMPGISHHMAALAEPMGCVLNGLSPLEGRQIDRAVIFGAGPMGLLMGIALRIRGTVQITMVDVNADRLAMAEGFGFQPMASGSGDLTGLHHACDLAVDATGIPAVAAGLIDYAANGGAVSFFGVCPSDARIEISPFEIFRRQLAIIGTHSLSHRDIPRALQVINSFGPDIERLVTHRLPMKEIAQIMAGHAPRGSMKVHMTL